MKLDTWEGKFYCHIVNVKPELKRVHLFQRNLGWAGLKWCCLQYSLKKRLVKSHLIFSSFLPSTFSAKISDYIVQKFQRRIRVSFVAQHHLAQHTPHSCGVHHIWFPSNQIPVQLYLILDLTDKVWLVNGAFKHRSRGGCTFSKVTDQY